MARRLSHYFVIVVAAAYVALKCLIFSKSAHLGRGITEADYFELAKVIVVLIAAGVSAFRLLQDRRSRGVESLDAPAANARYSTFRDWIRQLFTPLAGVSARHPILTPLLMLSLLAIPFGLRVLGTTKGWEGFGVRDWILVGLAEVPIVGTAVYVIFVSWRSKNR